MLGQIPPRVSLLLPEGGPALALVFEDALILSTLDTANTYEEPLSLKYPERFIGYYVAPPVDRGYIPLQATILLVASQSGVVLVDYDLDKVSDEVVIAPSGLPVGTASSAMVDDGTQSMAEDSVAEDKEDGAYELLRNQIEQAIFFAQEKNPISFRLDANSAQSLDTAVSSISSSIVQSKITYIDEIVQTKMQLTEKQVRLDALAAYLEGNKAMERVSSGVRKELCWNAEKVATALRGWRLRDQRANKGDRKVDMIALAVQSFFDRKRIKRTVDTQDGIHLFFKNYVAAIGDLFTDLHHVSKGQSDSRDSSTKAAMLSESNRILVVRVLLQLRREHRSQCSSQRPFTKRPFSTVQPTAKYMGSMTPFPLSLGLAQKV